jgi:hypothetical protein
VPSNQKDQFCVDTMLVSSSGLVANTVTAGDNSRKQKIFGKRKTSPRRMSLKQLRMSAIFSWIRFVMLKEISS